MIIALMGNDGSGKTTIAKKLVEIFRDLGFEVIYKHEYEYAILRILFKLIGQNRIEKSRKEMIVEKKKNWKYYLWPLLVWFDISLQYIYFKTFKRKSVIILDRYLYDHYMSFKYLGYLTRFTEWLYLHSPRPDIAIVLWVEPEVAYKRKKDTHSYPIEFYKVQTENYLKLSKKLRLPTVNTNKQLDDSILEVLRHVIQKFYKKGKYMELSKLANIQIYERDYKNVSVVIPTYKRNDKLLELLRSLLNSHVNDIKLEIIIVDDSENKSAIKVLKDLEVSLNRNVSKNITIQYVWSGGNKYPSFCRNLGARKSKGEVIIFIDDDNKLPSNTIKTIVYFLRKHPLVGLLGVVTYDSSGKLWSIGGKLIKTPFFIVLKNLKSPLFKDNLNFHASDYIPNLYALPRMIFDKIGGFDEKNFPQALEEVDLALRVWTEGYIVGVLMDPSVYTIHFFESDDNKPSRPWRYYLRGKSRMLFYYKYNKNLFKWRGLPDIFLRSLKVLMYRIPFKTKKELISNYINGIRDGLQLIKKKEGLK